MRRTSSHGPSARLAWAPIDTCEICRAGYQTSRIHREPSAPTGAQAQYAGLEVELARAGIGWPGFRMTRAAV